MELKVVPIEKPEDLNVIVGQAHFIKTVEDLHEALAGTSPHLRFGVAFNEASGPRLVRRSGNDDELVELATRNALAIAAGHIFVVFVREGFPVNVLNQVKQVPEVCTIHCATANAVGILVAQTECGRGVVGVIDGAPAARRGERRGRDGAQGAPANDRLQALTVSQQLSSPVSRSRWAVLDTAWRQTLMSRRVECKGSVYLAVAHGWSRGGGGIAPSAHPRPQQRLRRRHGVRHDVVKLSRTRCRGPSSARSRRAARARRHARGRAHGSRARARPRPRTASPPPRRRALRRAPLRRARRSRRRASAAGGSTTPVSAATPAAARGELPTGSRGAAAANPSGTFWIPIAIASGSPRSDPPAANATPTASPSGRLWMVSAESSKVARSRAASSSAAGRPRSRNRVCAWGTSRSRAAMKPDPSAKPSSTSPSEPRSSAGTSRLNAVAASITPAVKPSSVSRVSALGRRKMSTATPPSPVASPGTISPKSVSASRCGRLIAVPARTAG